MEAAAAQYLTDTETFTSEQQLVKKMQQHVSCPQEHGEEERAFILEVSTSSVVFSDLDQTSNHKTKTRFLWFFW